MDSIRERLDLIAAWLQRLAIRNLIALWIFLPVGAIALALAGYGWWWQVVADRVRDDVMTVQAAQLALGREMKWDAFELRGFPYKIEGTLSTLRLIAPDRGAAYDGERVVVRMHPFGLDSVALSLEGQQHLFFARERWIETWVRADTSLVTFTGEGNAARVDIDIERLTGKAKLDERDFNFIVDAAKGGVRLTAPGKGQARPHVELRARLKNVALQGTLELPLGPAIGWLDIDVSTRLPPKLTDVSLAGLTDAWKRTATPISIRRFELEWGGISVAAAGELKIDPQSMPEGRVMLTLGNHPRILELLRGAGWIEPETETLARKVLDVLAFMSGDEKRRVSVPLRIDKGSVYLGPAKVAQLTPEPAAAQLAPPEPATASP